MTEPTTLAGRSLLEDFPCRECDPEGWRDEVTVTIIAIEQEAREDERKVVAAKIVERHRRRRHVGLHLDRMAVPLTAAGRWLVERSNWNDGMRAFFVRINNSAGPDDMLVHVLTIEREARFKHTNRGMADRCDGRCATDECVCPDGGWHAECDRIEQKAAAAERERIAAGVREMPVWGLTHAYEEIHDMTEIRTSVLAIIEEHRDD